MRAATTILQSSGASRYELSGREGIWTWASLFDDTDNKGTPLSEMGRLIDESPENGERIFPYIGGEEVNDSPDTRYHRYRDQF